MSIPQRSSASAGPGGGPPEEPGPGGPAGDEWPDDLWPDDGGAPGPSRDPAGSGTGGGGGGLGEPSPAPARPADGPGGGSRRFRTAALVVTALAAAAAGAGIALAAHDLSSSPPAAAPSSQPSAPAPAPPGDSQPGASGTLPGGAPGGTSMLFIMGKVTAVSRTSITIGGPMHTVTAAVTSATRVTGRVSGIGGVRVGDQVSAQISQSGGRATATAIQDPAQAVPGGGLP